MKINERTHKVCERFADYATSDYEDTERKRLFFREIRAFAREEFQQQYCFDLLDFISPRDCIRVVLRLYYKTRLRPIPFASTASLILQNVAKEIADERHSVDSERRN